MTSICGTFMNCTETIGILVGTATQTTTGSLFYTFLMILLMIIAVAFLFGIKLEWTMVIVFPLLLAYMAYYSEFIGIGVVILIYLIIILTKTSMFR
jgi:hypothetical protein